MCRETTLKEAGKMISGSEFSRMRMKVKAMREMSMRISLSLMTEKLKNLIGNSQEMKVMNLTKAHLKKKMETMMQTTTRKTFSIRKTFTFIGVSSTFMDRSTRKLFKI